MVTMNINEDFEELFELLNKHDVEYLVIGGYAVSFHGHPRYTKDIDIWIGTSPDNADRVLIALAEFGFGELGISQQDLTTEDNIIQLGYPPRRIDLITTIKGVDFPECQENVSTATTNGGTVLKFISLKHLKANKKATGRPQDLADLDALSD
jgi:hypothetical protein